MRGCCGGLGLLGSSWKHLCREKMQPGSPHKFLGVWSIVFLLRVMHL
jgi:hypothetical protein